MEVALLIDGRCAYCGRLEMGRTWRGVRITKRALRTVGVGLAWMPQNCRECGGPVTSNGRHRLTAEDLQKVAAYRERKGWA